MARAAQDPAEPPREAAADEARPTRLEVLRAVDQLIDQSRVECLWYVRPDYYPRSDLERRQLLEAIQEHSTRDVFQRAGALKAWLSHHSSAESASS